MTHPVLYSFRRCPYAIRARLAVAEAGIAVELREVVLRDKPDAFLAKSASGTVPCLVVGDIMIDESRDIMVWALEKHDPAGWLNMPDTGWDWVTRADGPFKYALDRTKYAPRYPGTDPLEHRAQAASFLTELDSLIGTKEWMFDGPSMADYAILPFVRQFAFIDKVWFDAQPWAHVHEWLGRFLESDGFAEIMLKYPRWHDGDRPLMFP